MNPDAGSHRPAGPAGDAATADRRVLIVDDQAEFRVLARDLLELAGYEVVGEAEDGPAALRAYARLHPGIVLLDIQLGGMDGFAVAARLAEQDDPPAVVLTSSRDSGAYRRRLAVSTARGFIPKAELTGAALTAVIG
jgi:DNA-binding NarL/FixJ family response regulator